MCGITGFAQVEAAIGEDVLRRMTETLVRRGPDDVGFHRDVQIGLGMRRLSIIDIEGGRQPIWSASRRFVAVFNGEIYNYQELQRELRDRGVQFRSAGDGEVVVNLYEAFGVAAFERLRGMFSIALWDSRERVLLLVRDPLGIKPLFYRQAGQSLYFGSEIKSILAAESGRLAIDPHAIDVLLAYTYIPAPLTVWQSVRKLPAGHLLRWQNGRIQVSRYWDLLDAPSAPPLTTDELRSALDDSVRAHLVSDVEVGAFLSGGLDSSTIVARMQSQMEEKIRAFSVRFDAQSHLFDETGFAQELRDRYHFDLQIESLPSSGYDAVTEAMQAFDEPFADDSLMPSHAICALARRHLKVVLSGAGGDEFFGGYNRYQGVVLHQALGRVPRWVRGGLLAPALGNAARWLGPGTRRGDLARRFSTNLSRTGDEAYLAYVTSADPEMRRRLLAPGLAKDTDAEATREIINGPMKRAAGLVPLKRAMYTDVVTYLPEDVLALSDRIGMWHSLEIRTPFADKRLAETAFRLAPRDLVRLRQKKVALRRAVAPWLPPGILSHPKQGFEGPTASWFRAAGAATLQSVLREQAVNGPALVQVPFVEQLLAEHQAGKVDHAKRLFSVLALATWANLNAGRISGSG